MAKLRSLWLGELPLGEAFWTWAIGIGLLVGYALSVPYNVVAVVGVWRSAERYHGPTGHAELARIATVIVMVLLSMT